MSKNNKKLTTIIVWQDPSETPTPEVDSEIIYWDGVMFHTYFYYGKIMPFCEKWAYLPTKL